MSHAKKFPKDLDKPHIMDGYTAAQLSGAKGAAYLQRKFERSQIVNIRIRAENKALRDASNLIAGVLGIRRPD